MNNKFEFFLKDDDLQKLLRLYPGDVARPADGIFKGLVFSVEMVPDNEAGTKSYTLTGKVRSVCGKNDNTTGVPDKPAGNMHVMCPHPPPCTFTFAGDLQTDTTDAFKKFDDSCYR